MAPSPHSMVPSPHVPPYVRNTPSNVEPQAAPDSLITHTTETQTLVDVSQHR